LGLNERNVLKLKRSSAKKKKVLPLVCRWCLEAGVEFDAVDLMHCTNYLLPPGPADAAVCKKEAAECLIKSTVGDSFKKNYHLVFTYSLA
jgi:hypothetical protein